MSLLAKAASGQRLTPDEAVALYDLPLFDLAAAADAVRRQRTDPEVVTYLIDRNINYSNVCSVGCSFCGFYRTRRQADAYTLSYEQVSDKVRELEAVGGSRILMQGGVNRYLPFEWYLDLLRHLKEHHPSIRIEAFSPEEIKGMAKLTGMSSREVLVELQAAGLDGLPGGGGEMLVDEVRHERDVAGRPGEGHGVAAHVHVDVGVLTLDHAQQAVLRAEEPHHRDAVDLDLGRCLRQTGGIRTRQACPRSALSHRWCRGRGRAHGRRTARHARRC